MSISDKTQFVEQAANKLTSHLYSQRYALSAFGKPFLGDRNNQTRLTKSHNLQVIPVKTEPTLAT